jgi:hypothetical protein
MSADMMIISKEDNSSFEGDGTDKAFQIDETSMGEPWTEFGKWFGERYCGAPGILEQLHGISSHTYVKLTDVDIDAILKAFDSMEHRESLTRDKLEKFLNEHKDKHISTENW